MVLLASTTWHQGAFDSYPQPWIATRLRNGLRTENTWLSSVVPRSRATRPTVTLSSRTGHTRGRSGWPTLKLGTPKKFGTAERNFGILSLIWPRTPAAE